MSIGIDEALETVRDLVVPMDSHALEAVNTLCQWVEWRLKQERDEWEREEAFVRQREEEYK